MRTNCSSREFKALMATQFLGALNDNVFKLVVSLLVLNQLMNQGGGILPLILINICFVSPYILFSQGAGKLADTFSKSSVARATKMLEVVIMCLAFYFLGLKQQYPLLLVLFLMGTQSALFSPSKYGILPEMVTEKEISRANGYLEFWTFLAIIVGTALGGLLISGSGEELWLPRITVVVLALVGLFTSFFIREFESSPEKNKDSVNPFAVVSTIKEIALNKPLYLSVLAISFFWAVGGLYQLNLLLYAKQQVGLDDVGTSLLLTALAVGIGVGSIFAGKVSEGKVELGLVPIGGFGIFLTSLLLMWLHSSVTAVAVTLFLLGFACGMYVVPLNAYLQEYSPIKSRGRYIAACNILSFLGVIVSSLILWLLIEVFSVAPGTVFSFVAFAALAVTVAACRVLPEMMVRCVNWLVTHLLYRQSVIGAENVPKQGGALIVCNHVSYVDALLLLASIERPIRFIIFKPIYESKFIKPVVRMVKAIPIDAGGNPKQVVSALKQAREAVEAGELVCIFPEGGISRTGNMARFNSGLERIMKGLSAPIIPAYLDKVWGSIFSFKDGKPILKIPKRIPYPFTLIFGKPLAADTKARVLREEVQKLSTEAASLREERFSSLHHEVTRTAKKKLRKLAVVDSTGKRLTYLQLLTAAILLRKHLAKQAPSEQVVGVLLPSSVASVTTLLALSIDGKVSAMLNYTAGDSSIRSAIRQSALKTVITSKAFLEKTGLSFPDEKLVFIEDLFADIGGVEKSIVGATISLSPEWLLHRLFSFSRPGEKFDPQYRTSREEGRISGDTATILFSSGSTGEPKGVMLSHFNILANLNGLGDVIQLHSSDVIIGVLPHFHSFGYTATVWLPLVFGNPVVFHPNPIDGATIGELTKSNKGTILLSTPTFLLAYIRKIKAEQFASLRMVMVGAEKLTERVATAFEKKYGLFPLEGYGCTELSPVAMINVPDYEGNDAKQVGNKFGTVGHPIPGVSVEIVDPETFSPLANGEEGMIMVKGPSVMQGYLGNAELTDKVLHDNWYETGDIGKVDDDGFVTITDRLSRFSKIGGEMVPHGKIEEAIQSVAGAAERNVAVTAVPDEKKGERLVVLYSGELDVEAVRKTLVEEGIANLWIPKSDSFFQVEELPLLGSGKLDLKMLRTIAGERVAGL